jgi:hypothetical protein
MTLELEQIQKIDPEITSSAVRFQRCANLFRRVPRYVLGYVPISYGLTAIQDFSFIYNYNGISVSKIV